MGWETGVALGAGAVNSYSDTQNALAQSKAIAQSADYTAQNIANNTARTEGTLETSFIKGGIALNGNTGVQSVFQQAGAKGTTDIQRTIDNANASISNTMNAARTQALTGLAGTLSKLGPTAWNGLTGNTDPSADPAAFGSAADMADEDLLGSVGEL